MDNSDQHQPAFEGWAIIELMGHNTIAGYVTEAVIGGTAMLRVDVPATDTQAPYTKFFSGAAVYGITPTEEETAKTAATRLNRRPVDMWIVPDKPQLTDSQAEQPRFPYRHSDWDDDEPSPF